MTTKRPDRAPLPDPSPVAVPLTALCIIHGCLCLRVGSNLCPSHQNPNLPWRERCHRD